MNFSSGWVDTPLASAIGYALLDSLWQGAIIAAVLAAALWISRSPRVRYSAACGAMVLLAGSVIFTLLALVPEDRESIQAASGQPSIVWRWATVASTPDAWAPSLARFAPWLAPFWAAGVLIFSLRNVISFVSVGQLRRRGACCAPVALARSA